MPQARASAGLGALAWAAVPLYLVAELVAIVAVRVRDAAPYDPLRNVISDLGAAGCTTIAYPYGEVPVCSPASLVINLAFVACGVLVIAGAVFTAQTLRPGRGRRIGMWLWIVVGLAAIGSAVPLDVDLALHTALSLPMVLQGAAMWATAGALGERAPTLARWGRLLGLVSLAAAAAMLAVSMSGWYIGLWQRLSVWPGYLWLGVVGWVLWRVRQRDDAPRPGGPGRRVVGEREDAG